MNKVLYPKVKVRLTGESANAFSIMNRVSVAMEKAGVPLNIRKKYVREAASGWNYEKMLEVTSKWVSVK
jgi:hypothetical protein